MMNKSESLVTLTNAEFKNTGLERADRLGKDLEWFKEQGYSIPEPMTPGKIYAQYLKDIEEKDPQAFICHFYMIYFGQSAGGRMVGTKVSKKILDDKELAFYKWGRITLWTIEEKNHCLEEIEESFKLSGEILRLLLS
ncbi:hypothetical protein EUTSA_v10024132mg [Eutrema salsugineum]|uniref:heme oxygenase (biliverdin-producing) n=1 Tax=Eutrema salsugineum TaxID=72664 RepID=V4KQ92_EUTSA|nr:hypothetical protein EUTSA_v10024132mg [Eutrema salsugineum]